MAPPSTSSAFSSTSWLDFFVFSKTGNLVAVGLVVVVIAAVVLLAHLGGREPRDF